MTESEEYIMMTLQIGALGNGLRTIGRTPWWKVFTIWKTASAAMVKSREIEDRFRQQVGRAHRTGGPRYTWFGVEL